MNVADPADPDPKFYGLVLGFWMLQLREESGQTQEAVSSALGLGPSVLSDYERLRHSPSPAVAEQIFRHYGIDEDRLETVKAFAREARRRRARPTDPAIPEWFGLYQMLERHASELDLFALTLIPGLFQTREYAHAVLGAGVYNPAADLDRLVDVRLARQELLKNPEFQVSAVIKETALLSAVGGPQVMVDQLDRLLELGRQPNILIYVLPNAAGAHASMGAEFAFLRFNLTQLAIAYCETLTGALYEKTPAGIAVYDKAYRLLTSAALSKEPSLRLIEQIRDSYQQ